MTEWKPIETAPRDGTEFLAFYPKTLYGPAAFYIVSLGADDPTNVMIEKRNIYNQSCHPTHWMPLPNPPKEKTDD